MSATKILCPVDFSPGSLAALRMAVRLANDADEELVLVHSWFVPPSAFAELTYPSDMIEAMHDEAKRGLELAVRDAKEAGAKQVSWKLLTGVPWTAIAQEAEHREYRLVVIGTHGRTGVSRFFLGSVAEKVIRHSPCSVMVVRPDAEAKPFEHALCPIDFSESSHAAMLMAGDLVRRGGAGVTLLHAVEPPAWTREAPVLEFENDQAGRASKALTSWAGELKNRVDVPVSILTSIGSPAGETLERLDTDRSIDLVVMGSRGRTGIKRALLGSVAERVARHARCSVVVTRKRD